MQELDPVRPFLCCPPWFNALRRPRLSLEGPCQAPLFPCKASPICYRTSNSRASAQGKLILVRRRARCIYSKWIQHAFTKQRLWDSALEGSRAHQQRLVQQSLSRRGCRCSQAQFRHHQSPPQSPALISGQFVQDLGLYRREAVKMSTRTPVWHPAGTAPPVPHVPRL